MSKNVKKKPQKIAPVKKQEFSPEIVEYEVAWNEGTNLSRLQFGNGRLDISVEE